jgi:hypothetical protein
VVQVKPTPRPAPQISRFAMARSPGKGAIVRAADAMVRRAARQMIKRYWRRFWYWFIDDGMRG